MFILYGKYKEESDRSSFYNLSLSDSDMIQLEVRKNRAIIRRNKVSIRSHSDSTNDSNSFLDEVKEVYKDFKKIVDKVSKDKLFVDLSDLDALGKLIEKQEAAEAAKKAAEEAAKKAAEEADGENSDDNDDADDNDDDSGTEDDDKGTEDSDDEAVMP